MRMFSEQVQYTSSNSPLNIISVKDFQEVLFGVFEVELNGRKYMVEEISKNDGNPVVSVPIEQGGVVGNYPFVLVKGKQEILFNEKSEPVEIFESKIEEIEKEERIDEIIEEFEEIDDEIILDKKNEIIEEILKIKKESVEKAKEELRKKSKILNEKNKQEIKKKEIALQKYLETARENLVDEFVNVSKKIKNELISDNDKRFLEIKDTIDNKIKDISVSLNESLKNDFQKSSKLVDKSIKQLVKELYTQQINPRVDKELNNIALDVVEKISEIDKNLNKNVNKKADLSLVEGVVKEINSIRDANIELNNSLNKGVQKALSRVGNVDKKIVEVSEKFERKIEKTEKDISNFFNEKLELLKEETFNITDEARSYFQNLIQESRNNLLAEIRKIKNEKPVEYILESKKGEQIVKDWDVIEKDWDKKIHDKFEKYKTDLRKYVTVYASGGGTNALQLAEGGVINGDLNVTGSILSGGINLLDILGGGSSSNVSNYLPLSGGTITGDLNVFGLLSAESIKFEVLSTNPAYQEGLLFYTADTNSVNLYVDRSDVILQLGEENWIRGYNDTGGTLTKGTVVYVSGSQGSSAANYRPKIWKAIANSAGESHETIGVLADTINQGETGYVITFGNVNDLNTQGFTAGDMIYVSPYVAGTFTNIRPTPPYHTIKVGYVLLAHPNNGKILVSINNGYEMDELHDVLYSSLSNNDILVYDSLSALWRNSKTLVLSSLSASNGNSNQWTSTYTTVQSNSANWNNTYTTLSTKANLNGGNALSGDQTIAGTLSTNNTITGSIGVFPTINGNTSFSNNINILGQVTATNQTLAGDSSVVTRGLLNSRLNQRETYFTILTADGGTVTNSTTYVDTGLGLSSVPIGTYIIEMQLNEVVTTSGNGGLKYQIVVAGSGGIGGGYVQNTLGGFGGTLNGGGGSASSTLAFATGATQAGYVARTVGTIVLSGGNTNFTVQHALNSTDAANPSRTTKANSYLKLTRVLP